MINLSLGGARLSTVDAAMAGLPDSIVATVAAGNENTACDNVSPAAAGDNVHIFTIGAHDSQGDRAFFTNFCDQVKVSAQGVSIPVKNCDGSDGTLSGRSFSARHAAGAAAVLLSDGKPVSLENLITGTDTVQYPSSSTTERILSQDQAVKNLFFHQKSSSFSNLRDETLIQLHFLMLQRCTASTALCFISE